MTEHERTHEPRRDFDEREEELETGDHASPGGAAAAGAVTGGAVGAVGAGPLGAAVGAGFGALAGVATERAMHADEEGVANVPDARGGPIVTDEAGVSPRGVADAREGERVVVAPNHEHRWEADNRCGECGTLRT